MRAPWFRALAWLLPTAVLGGLGVSVIAIVGCQTGGGFCSDGPTDVSRRWVLVGGAAVAVAGALAGAAWPRRRALGAGVGLVVGLAVAAWLGVPRW